MSDKRAVTIAKDIKDIASFFLSHDQKVKVIIFDHEQTFIACERSITGILFKYIPAGNTTKLLKDAFKVWKSRRTLLKLT